MYFPVRSNTEMCVATSLSTNEMNKYEWVVARQRHREKKNTTISNGTKNVLCCQRATALKELNGDNSVVIKFPVYFLRSHLQVYLLNSVPDARLMCVCCFFFILYIFSILLPIINIALYLESVWINFLLGFVFVLWAIWCAIEEARSFCTAYTTKQISADWLLT